MEYQHVRLNLLFWVAFIVLALCVLLFHLSSAITIGIYTLEYTSMYRMDTLACV